MAPKYKRALTVDEYTTEKCDVIANKLLGDYNANGIYVINKKVAEELLNTKKIKKESFNNEIFCTTKTSSGRIVDFDISFKKNSQSNMAVAELYVLEGVPKQGGRMMNVLKTPIAKFTQEITPNFVDLALAKFNVGVDASDEGQEMKEVDDIYISKRTTLLGYLDKMTADNYNIVYEDFFTQRINLLKSMNNSYSKKILAIFNEEFNKVSDMFLIDKKHKKVTNFKAMNELLDKAFEDLAGLEQYEEQEKMYKEKILPILAMFIQGAERIESSSMKSVLDTVPKRLKDELTEPLIDKKQMGESRMEPTVKETSKKTLKQELDSSMEDMAGKIDKYSRARGKGKGKGDGSAPTIDSPETPTKGISTTKGPTKPTTVTEFGHEGIIDEITGDKKRTGAPTLKDVFGLGRGKSTSHPTSEFSLDSPTIITDTTSSVRRGNPSGMDRTPRDSVHIDDSEFTVDGAIPGHGEATHGTTKFTFSPQAVEVFELDRTNAIKNVDQVIQGSFVSPEGGNIFGPTNTLTGDLSKFAQPGTIDINEYNEFLKAWSEIPEDVKAKYGDISEYLVKKGGENLHPPKGKHQNDIKQMQRPKTIVPHEHDAGMGGKK